MQYCSLLHQTLLSPPDTSTTEHHFCFGPAASFFLELLLTALHSSPEAYWTPSDLRGSSSSVIYFCLFILFMGFSWQEYWSGFPCPSSSGSRFVRTLHCDLSVVGSPARHGSYLRELPTHPCHNKAMIHEGELMVTKGEMCRGID